MPWVFCLSLHYDLVSVGQIFVSTEQKYTKSKVSTTDYDDVVNIIQFLNDMVKRSPNSIWGLRYEISNF